MSRYDLSQATVGELLADQEVLEIVERYRPGLATSADAAAVAHLPVEQALKLAERYARPGELDDARAELDALQ